MHTLHLRRPHLHLPKIDRLRPATGLAGSFPVDRDRERMIAELRAIRDPAGR